MDQQGVFRALADPTRREILRRLRGGPPMSAGEIADHFEISKASLSHHFNVLKAADLVTAERQGQQIIYSLNTSVFEEVATLFFNLFDSRTNRKEDRR